MKALLYKSGGRDNARNLSSSGSRLQRYSNIGESNGLRNMQTCGFKPRQQDFHVGRISCNTGTRVCRHS